MIDKQMIDFIQQVFIEYLYMLGIMLDPRDTE